MAWVYPYVKWIAYTPKDDRRDRSRSQQQRRPAMQARAELINPEGTNTVISVKTYVNPSARD